MSQKITVVDSSKRNKGLLIVYGMLYNTAALQTAESTNTKHISFLYSNVSQADISAVNGCRCWAKSLVISGRCQNFLLCGLFEIQIDWTRQKKQKCHIKFWQLVAIVCILLQSKIVDWPQVCLMLFVVCLFLFCVVFLLLHDLIIPKYPVSCCALPSSECPAVHVTFETWINL